MVSRTGRLRSRQRSTGTMRSGSSGSRMGARSLAPPAAHSDVPVCSCCSEPAVIYRPADHRHLCGTHLVYEIETRVASAIDEAGQIHAGHRVAVALSGERKVPRSSSSFPGCCVRGQGQISSPSPLTRASPVSRRYASGCKSTDQTAGVDHHIVSFRDLIGDDLDTLLSGREEQACTICGILRKKALADAARDPGATVIATGHNLDDEAQSVLMNALRGILPRLIRNTGTGKSALFPPPDKTPCCRHGKGDRGLPVCAGSLLCTTGMPIYEIRITG